MKRRKTYLTVLGISWAALMLSGLALYAYIIAMHGEHIGDLPFLLFCIPLVITSVIMLLGFKYCRCQHCGKLLIKVSLKEKYCPYCNGDLQSDD